MGTHHPLVVGQSQPRPLLLQTPPSLVSLNVDNAAAPREPAMTPRPTTSCRPLCAPPLAVSHHITFPFLSQPMPHAPTPTRRIHLSCFDDAHAAVLPCSSLLGTGCSTPRIPEEPEEPERKPREPSACDCDTSLSYHHPFVRFFLPSCSLSAMPALPLPALSQVSLHGLI